MGTAPNGKRATITGLTIDRFENGEIVGALAQHPHARSAPVIGALPGHPEAA